MKLQLRNLPELRNVARLLRAATTDFAARKAEYRRRYRKERQCTGTSKTGERCRAWAVAGDPKLRCVAHGGIKTADSDACRCEAYTFPHRRRSGLCNYPEPPLGKCLTPQGQRRYYKRQRKREIKNWSAGRI